MPFREVEQILQDFFVEYVHGQNVVPDQAVAGVGREHLRCHEHVRVAVALVLHRAAYRQRRNGPLYRRRPRVLPRVHVRGEVDVRLEQRRLQQVL